MKRYDLLNTITTLSSSIEAMERAKRTTLVHALENKLEECLSQLNLNETFIHDKESRNERITKAHDFLRTECEHRFIPEENFLGTLYGYHDVGKAIEIAAGI